MKKQTFKFKTDLYSNGTSLSDGHFLAPVETNCFVWKCPSDQTTAALVRKEAFSYSCKELTMGDCPNFQAILDARKEATNVLTDTRLTIKEGEMHVHLYWSTNTGLVGIDETYYFLLRYQEIRTKDNLSPLFAEENIVVMPVKLDLNPADFRHYFSQSIQSALHQALSIGELQ